MEGVLEAAGSGTHRNRTQGQQGHPLGAMTESQGKQKAETGDKKEERKNKYRLRSYLPHQGQLHGIACTAKGAAVWLPE